MSKRGGDMSGVEQAGRALRAAEERVAEARAALAAELRQGRANDAPWAELAAAAGLTPSRVHQIVSYEGRKRPEGKA